MATAKNRGRHCRESENIELRTSEPSMRRFSITALLALWICSCSLASMRPTPPEISPVAARRISNIEKLNQGLDSFKGIGNLRLSGAKGRQTLRAAWIAQMPDRFRLELLGVTGAPVASVAADGTYFTAYLHDSRKQYRHRLGEDGLERVVGVELKVAEVVSMLGGRVFIAEFRKAVVEEGVLILKDGVGRKQQAIYPPGEQNAWWVVERFDERGELRYRAILEDLRQADGYLIPGRIVVTTEGGDGFQVSVDRFWANPAVAPSAFVLDEAP